MSAEARRNVIALGIAAVILAAFAALSWRPAAILPVTDHAVASSLSQPNAECLHADEGFRCVVHDPLSSDAPRTLSVRVGWDGCWHAVPRGAAKASAPGSTGSGWSGCVALWDY
jgi:hypothetical protein